MADASTSPSSVDELVAYISSVVEERFRSNRQSTDGAFLAEKVRQRFPSLSYEQLGLVKLADAISYGESKGLLLRNRGVKHLDVLPAGSGDTFGSTPSMRGVIGLPHVRPDVWRAFVFVSQGHEYCFDRETGNVVNAQSLGDRRDAERYVNIPTASIEEQRRWMAEFLASNTDLEPNEAPIYDEWCFTRFPEWLRERGSNLDRLWKQFRVKRVADQIRQWAAANSIDPSSFFSTPIRPIALPTADSDSRHERAIRSAICAAARELPLHQLESITIPLRFVLEALKAR
jgi:hypothetical protein